MEPKGINQNGKGLVIFFALTFGWSWLFWIAITLLNPHESSLLITSLRYIGGIGPLLSTIILVHFKESRDISKNYWKRVIDFRRISGRWYAAIFLIVPALAGLAALLDIISNGWGIRLESAIQIAEQPWMIITFPIFILLFGPVPEELGWRGYALDRLQFRWNALISSLVLGTAWALWHIPLFFIEGTYQYNLGFGSLNFWIFMGSLIPQAILITWVYNNTQRSTLAAILFHFMGNFIGELFELSQTAMIYQFALWIAVSILVVSVWGPKKLAREKGDVAKT
ncbi:MAG: CPBP family intramembrane metalloprotease [Dehalococcoidaceae bacterium]|nr:CPBP family intramembrane metalloprotease [Dehalococcoidaceae bacterium]